MLATGKPKNGQLSAWNWSYPAGSGEYAALYPKSWFAYQSPQLPIKLTVEGDTRVTVTASIGIAVGVRSSAEELLRDADIAMYRAKANGKAAEAA